MEKAEIVENLNSQKNDLYKEIGKVIIGQENIINQNNFRCFAVII